MGHIYCTDGTPVLVDDNMVDYLSRWRWYYRRTEHRKGSRFVRRTIDGVLLSDVVFFNDTSLTVDHINRNPLDNRLVNLRLATSSQNQANNGLRADNTSGYKGVSWSKSSLKWVSKINVNGRKLHLGYFDTKEEAARRYDLAAIVFFGEYACTNASLGLYPDQRVYSIQTIENNSSSKLLSMLR